MLKEPVVMCTFRGDGQCGNKSAWRLFQPKAAVPSCVYLSWHRPAVSLVEANRAVSLNGTVGHPLRIVADHLVTQKWKACLYVRPNCRR